METEEGGSGDTRGIRSTGDRGSSRLVGENSQDGTEIDEEVKERRLHRGRPGVTLAKGTLAQQGH